MQLTLASVVCTALSTAAALDLRMSVGEHTRVLGPFEPMQPGKASRTNEIPVSRPFGDSSTTQNCYWSGTSPFCAGACDPGYTDSGTSSCGDGACCWSGYKKYCCKSGAIADDGKPLRANDKPAQHHLDTARIEHTRLPGPSTTQNCYWSGTSPFCAGACDPGYTDSGTSSCGDGACCWSGYKKYCCKAGSMDIAQDSSMTPVHKGEKKSRDARTFEGDNDDLCGDDELICCAPGAEKNSDCSCVKKPSESFKLRSMSRKPGLARVTDDDEPENDICKEGEHLCCNPGAERNKECACLPAETGSSIEL